MCTLMTETFCLMCHTQELRLFSNNIGDAGLTALAKAVESGALASLSGRGPPGTLVVDNSEHPALNDACQARDIDLL